MTGGLFIDGVWRAGAGARMISTDPATGAVVWEGASADFGDVLAAVAAARRAFQPWADLPLEDRVAALRRYRSALDVRAEAMARDFSRETGKPLWETRTEIAAMMAKVEVSITAQAERAGERTVATAFGQAVLRHRPHGVMAVLGPFNFPGHLPNGHITPALLAGDTVVFKPSEETPLAAQWMIQAFEAADFPPGVVNLVQGGRETGAALLDQPIDGLLFTGSAEAGALFGRKFVDRPEVILALELGGDNPLIVWGEVEVEAAAAVIVQSAFITTGQRCSCARRLILPEGVVGDRIVEATAALAQRLRIGAWDEPDEPFMGPVISVRAAAGALARVQALIARGGCDLLPFRVDDAFVTPAMIEMTGIQTPDQEIFAPVLQVQRASDFDAAIALANATRFGLSAGLVTKDETLWRRFVQRSRAGVVNWNRPTTGAASNMPFGGLGASGNHRPSAYYAADYCAYPMASFEASRPIFAPGDIKGLNP
jgi:succinylglutamic semialdehyde dehydrogenase